MHLLNRKKDRQADLVISPPSPVAAASSASSSPSQFPVAPPTRISNLDEEIRTIWSKPLRQSPVNKDLPRLAPRITVIYNDKPVVGSSVDELKPMSPRSNPNPQPLNHQQSRRLMNNVEQRLSVMLEGSELAKQMRLQPELLEKSAIMNAVDAKLDGLSTQVSEKKEKKAFGVWITKRLPPEVYTTRRATEKWTNWDGPGLMKLKTDARGVLVELKLKNEGEPSCKFQSTEIVDMIDSTRYFASRVREPPQPDRICGFAFHAREDAVLFREVLSAMQLECLQPNEPPEKEGQKMLRPVQKVVMEVMQRLESREAQARGEAAFAHIASQRSGDLEITLPDLWQAIGEDSRTARLFKAIHQNIIFVPIFHLKKAIPTPATRDMRTPEGWRIFVHISPDVVVITHSRREQALATQPPEEYFWVEWQLRLLFDAHLTDMRAARLRITNLGFGERTTEAKKRDYNIAFANGNMVLF